MLQACSRTEGLTFFLEPDSMTLLVLYLMTRVESQRDDQKDSSRELDVVKSLFSTILLRISMLNSPTISMLNIGDALCSTPQSLADAHY